MTVVWGDGTATTMATVNPDGTFSATHTYADNPPTGTTYGVTLTVADDDGASVSINASIEVDNVPPSVALSGAGAVTVGGTYALGFSASDPGTDTVSAWQVDWGDGTVQTYAGTATGADHVYNLPGSYTMSVSAADEDSQGGYYMAVTKGVVAGVSAADISAGGPYTTVQGGSVTLTATAPGTVSSYGWDVNGDGHDDVTSQTGSVTLSWSQLNQLGIVDAGRFPVTATATYADGVSVTSAAPAHLIVTNTPPTVADLAFSPSPAQEGQAVTVTGRVVDPGTRDVESVMVQWGDGTAATLATVNADRTFTAVHTYADNPTTGTTYTVTLTVADDNGGSYQVSAPLTVTNVPPTVTVTGATVAAVGQAYALAFSATDPGTDTISSWRVDWGDGTVDTFAGTAAGAGHVYEQSAAYTVAVSAMDEDSLGYYPSVAKLVIVPARVQPVVPDVTPAASVLPMTVVQAMANNGGNTTVGLLPLPTIDITPIQLPNVPIAYVPPTYSADPQFQSNTYIFAYDGGDRGNRSRTETPKTDSKPQQQQNQDGTRSQPNTQDAQPAKTDGETNGQPRDAAPASGPTGERGAPQGGQNGNEAGERNAAPTEDKGVQQQQQEQNREPTNDGAAAPAPAPQSPAAQPPAAQPPAAPEGTLQQQGNAQTPDRRARRESPEWVYLGALAAVPAIAANDVKVPAGWSMRDKAGRDKAGRDKADARKRVA